jgi:integrase
MTSRRGQSEGSVYLRTEVGPDGKERVRWCASVTIGYDDKGKRKRRTYYGSTKKEVLAKLGEAQSAAAKGGLAEANRETLAVHIRRWLKVVAKPRLKDSSLYRYERLTELHTIPAIGGVRLTALRRHHIQAFHAQMAEKGLSKRTQEFAHAVLRSALQDALESGHIATNVCDLVARPKPARHEMQTFNEEQARAFLKATAGDRFEPAYLLALSCDMREGEILGLQWQDVSFDDAALSIRRTVGMVRGKTAVGEPKTAQARRRIDMPESVITSLKEHRKRMVAFGYPATLWVFPNTHDGGPTRPDVLVGHYKEIRDAAKMPDGSGLPRIRFHDLRHTAATLQLLKGTHPKVVQERLGHSKIGITLDTYSHVLPSMQKDASKAMDELFGDVISKTWLHGGYIQAKKGVRKGHQKVTKIK